MPENRAKKIKNQNEIIKSVRTLKAKGKKIVTINGSFDLLHIGHIESLRRAKAKGDILIVLLNSDESVRSYKGSGRPIITQYERAEMLAAIEFVDFVTIFNEINPKKILDRIKPDIHCNALDWGKNCIEREVVEKNGGVVSVLNWKNKNASTTKIINRIVDVYSRPQRKTIFLDRDGTININNRGYTHRIKDFHFIPRAIEALKLLANKKYRIVIVTNQSGIGRGYFSEKDVLKLHRWMSGVLRGKGITIEKIYYCPHVPEENCLCRKPKTGMVMQAVKNFDISLNESWIVGDDERDIMMGREVNIRTIKIGKKFFKGAKIAPHYYARDLLDASKIILSEDRK